MAPPAASRPAPPPRSGKVLSVPVHGSSPPSEPPEAPLPPEASLPPDLASPPAPDPPPAAPAPSAPPWAPAAEPVASPTPPFHPARPGAIGRIVVVGTVAVGAVSVGVLRRISRVRLRSPIALDHLDDRRARQCSHSALDVGVVHIVGELRMLIGPFAVLARMLDGD